MMSNATNTLSVRMAAHSGITPVSKPCSQVDTI